MFRIDVQNPIGKVICTSVFTLKTNESRKLFLEPTPTTQQTTYAAIQDKTASGMEG